MSTSLDPERLLTLEAVAARWGVSTKTVKRTIKRGDLPHVRIGNQIRLRPDDVLKYEDRR